MPRKRMDPVGSPPRKLIKLPEETIDPEEMELEPSQDEIEDAQKLDEFRQQYGGNEYTVRVQRYNEESSEMEIVDRFDFDTFDPYILGKKYGGGKFVCTLFNDKGRYVQGGRFRYNFAKPKEVEEKKTVDPLENPAIQLFIETSKAQSAMLSDLLKASLTSEKSTDIDKLVGALKGLHDMNPPGQKDNPMKSLKELLELQNLIQGTVAKDEDEKGPGFMSEIVDALKYLNQSKNIPLPARGLSSPGPLQPRVISPGVAGPLIRSPQPAIKEEVKEMNPAIDVAVRYAPEFEKAALNNEDPEKWAAFLIDVLELQIVPALVKHYDGFVDSEGVWDRLLDAADDEEKILMIYEFAPTLQLHHEWVKKVIQAAKKQFDEPDVTASKNGDEGEK